MITILLLAAFVFVFLWGYSFNNLNGGLSFFSKLIVAFVVTWAAIYLSFANLFADVFKETKSVHDRVKKQQQND